MGCHSPFLSQRMGRNLPQPASLMLTPGHTAAPAVCAGSRAPHERFSSRSRIQFSRVGKKGCKARPCIALSASVDGCIIGTTALTVKRESGAMHLHWSATADAPDGRILPERRSRQSARMKCVREPGMINQRPFSKEHGLWPSGMEKSEHRSYQVNSQRVRA
jgi:hypothetical protein